MTLTYKEFKRIRNDDEEVVRLIKSGVHNATKNEVNPYYEFEKKNRMKVRNALTKEEENREKIIKDLFIAHYKCELNKVLNRLIFDITDICTYMKEITMPVTILHPKNTCSCTKADVKFCFQNFQLI